MKCSHCLNEVSHGKFCVYCGAPLIIEEKEIPKPEPATAGSAVMVGPADTAGASSWFAPASDLSDSEPIEVSKVYSDEPFFENNKYEQSEYMTDAHIPEHTVLNDDEIEQPFVWDNEQTEQKPAANKTTKRLIIILYVLIAIFTIVLGSMLGYLGAKGKLPFFSTNVSEDSDFHWNTPDDATHSVTVMEQDAESDSTN